MTDSLAALAGGDIFELAVQEIRDDVDAAHARLAAEFPQFYPDLPTTTESNQ